MIKYFLNLKEIKCYAEKFKRTKNADPPLIAAIGSKEKVEYLLLLNVLKPIDGFQLEVTRVKDLEIEEIVYLSSDNWIETIKRIANYYDRKVKENVEYDCTSVCDNPSCAEYGNQVDIIKDDTGRIICPHCGEEIGAEAESPEEDMESHFEDEEDELYEEVDRERLVEIIYDLIQYILIKPDGNYDIDLIDFLGIDMEEIESIIQEYGI